MKAMRRNASDGSSNNNKQSSLTSNRDSVDSAHSLPVSTQPRDNCSISSPSQARQCGDSGGSPYSNQSSPESRVTKRKQCKRWPPMLKNRKQVHALGNFFYFYFLCWFCFRPSNGMSRASSSSSFNSISEMIVERSSLEDSDTGMVGLFAQNNHYNGKFHKAVTWLFVVFCAGIDVVCRDWERF